VLLDRFAEIGKVVEGQVSFLGFLGYAAGLRCLKSFEEFLYLLRVTRELDSLLV